ncbi:MAG: FtsQ-type POTRA domain-containing protein [Opitutales bacterium]|nr:FtsQ-type POTRA domain-containing protein [Opitutales bacterium]
MAVKRTKKINNNWRNLINGPNKKHKSVSWLARIRIFLGQLKYVVIIASVVAIAYGCYYVYSNAFFNDIVGTESESIKHIEFKTDGLITARWIGNYIKLKKNIKLADVNIFAIKNALENLTQVKTAKVERIYPNKLRVTISEYMPMAKFITEIDMRTVLYAISPEGVFYEPICMNEKFIEKLPLITGYQINFNGRSPQDLKCAQKIVDFLAYTQAHMPMNRWKSINVRELGSVTNLIVATTEDDIKIIFAAKDYPKQFERIEYIMRYYAKENKRQEIKQIDLSLKERADVKPKDSKNDRK